MQWTLELDYLDSDLDPTTYYLIEEWDPTTPGPARAGRRRLRARGPPALRISLRIPLRSPPRLQAARTGREPVVAPRHPHLPSQAQGRSSSLASHRSPCGRNGKEASPPPAPLRQTG